MWVQGFVWLGPVWASHEGLRTSTRPSQLAIPHLPNRKAYAQLTTGLRCGCPPRPALGPPTSTQRCRVWRALPTLPDLRAPVAPLQPRKWSPGGVRSWGQCRARPPWRPGWSSPKSPSMFCVLLHPGTVRGSTVDAGPVFPPGCRRDVIPCIPSSMCAVHILVRVRKNGRNP